MATENSVERIEPNSAGINILQEIIHNSFEWQIKRDIMGQTLTSEAGGTAEPRPTDAKTPSSSPNSSAQRVHSHPANTRTSTALLRAGVPRSKLHGLNQTGNEIPNAPGITYDDLAKRQTINNRLPLTGTSAPPQ